MLNESIFGIAASLLSEVLVSFGRKSLAVVAVFATVVAIIYAGLKFLVELVFKRNRNETVPHDELNPISTSPSTGDT